MINHIIFVLNVWKLNDILLSTNNYCYLQFFKDLCCGGNSCDVIIGKVNSREENKQTY